jgi:small ligand-binding sensory domain FIST
MSNSTIPPQGSLQSKATVLGPGIAGLFLQGIESGLVVAEFCRWFSMERNDGAAFSSFVVFVTVVGL